MYTLDILVCILPMFVHIYIINIYKIFKGWNQAASLIKIRSYFVFLLFLENPARIILS